MKFTDIFVRRPVLAAVVSLLILLIGLRAFFELPVRQYPELKNTVITVTTSYPGASAELMQGFITTPIAQAVASAEGIDYMTASSMQGQSTVKAFIQLNWDPNVAMTDVMAKVQQVKYQIPQEANDPVILKSTGDTTAVMYMGFSSPELTGPAITDYLTRVVQPLLATAQPAPPIAAARAVSGTVIASATAYDVIVQVPCEGEMARPPAIWGTETFVMVVSRMTTKLARARPTAASHSRAPVNGWIGSGFIVRVCRSLRSSTVRRAAGGLSIAPDPAGSGRAVAGRP